MNARGVLAFMACIVLFTGVAQAAPYYGMYYYEDFNYEDQAAFNAAWPMSYTSTSTRVANPITLSGSTCPGDPLYGTEWAAYNMGIGGTPASSYDMRNYDIVGSSWTDMSFHTEYDASCGPRDVIIDFWMYDYNNSGSGRQWVEFRNYTTAVNPFPINVGTSAYPGGYSFFLAFGINSGTSTTEYMVRTVGSGTPGYQALTGLTRSIGWHHFQIKMSQTSATTGLIEYWDLTSGVKSSATTTATAVSSYGLGLNSIHYGSYLASNQDLMLDVVRITPEPVSLALLGLGSLLLRRRRA